MKQKPDRKGIADRLRRAAIIIERDHVGGFESAGRRIIDVADEIGELIDWQGEGYNSPTSQGYKVTRSNKLEEEAPSYQSPELSEVLK